MSAQQPKSANGSQYCAAFAQLLGLCVEGRSVFLCDAAAGRLKLVTPVTGLTMYLEALYNVYKAFGIHSDCEPTLDMAIHTLGAVLNFFGGGVNHIRAVRGMTRTQLQGPDGAVASKTVDSVEVLLNSLSSLDALVNSFGLADFKEETALNSLLTLLCERFFSDMRSPFEMHLMLQFVHLAGSNLRASLKRMTVCGFCYYMSRKSYYPCQQVSQGLHFLTFPKMPVPNPVQMDSVSIKMLHDYQKEYGQSVRQQSVRSFSTKDKPGTLPISAYLQKEPQIIPLTLSDGVHQTDEQPLHQPDHQTIILPSGTAAAVQGRSCLIITSKM